MGGCQGSQPVNTEAMPQGEQDRKTLPGEQDLGQERGSARLSTLIGAPTAACLPPGECVFGEEFSTAKLLERQRVTHDTILLTWALADETKPLGLPTCACLLAMFKEAGSPDPIVRPYTPVSTNALLGKFQLCVKVYEGGKMSKHMEGLPTGCYISFKHIPVNVKIQYPFGKKNLTMLTGGTGITPMMQALHAILGTAGDETNVTMLFGNRTQKDIVCGDLLDRWSADFGKRFKVVHVLSNAADDASWTGAKGRIGKTIIAEHCAPPGADTKVFVCGPPPMYDALCGPRDQPNEITGVLKDMGYSADMVFKF